MHHINSTLQTMLQISIDQVIKITEFLTISYLPRDVSNKSVWLVGIVTPRDRSLRHYLYNPASKQALQNTPQRVDQDYVPEPSLSHVLGQRYPVFQILHFGQQNT